MLNLKNFSPNKGKKLEIEVKENNTWAGRWVRIPIKTHLITKDDVIEEVLKKYLSSHLKENDLIFISERIVSICQGRAYPIKEIKPSLIAKILSKFVHKSPYGIGLGSPWTMELAIREAGILRILIGTFFAAITKPFGIKGIFYKIVGKNINAIDGPCSYTLPPYNEYAKLGPKEPNKVAEKLKYILNCDVVIIDANDLGVKVLGKSNKSIPDGFCEKVFRDNPLGQSKEQTPLAIVRRLI
jgi:F420-0:gamma-glutamyl ligase-like protein